MMCCFLSKHTNWNLTCGKSSVNLSILERFSFFFNPKPGIMAFFLFLDFSQNIHANTRNRFLFYSNSVKEVLFFPREFRLWDLFHVFATTSPVSAQVLPGKAGRGCLATPTAFSAKTTKHFHSVDMSVLAAQCALSAAHIHKYPEESATKPGVLSLSYPYCTVIIQYMHS